MASAQITVKNTFLTLEAVKDNDLSTMGLKGFRRSCTAPFPICINFDQKPSISARDSVCSVSTACSLSSTLSKESEHPLPVAAGRLGRFARRNQDEEMTTVMIRNIPCKYNQDWLMQEISEVTEQFNFFYMPMARKSPGCLGYAFVNFVTEDDASEFLESFQGHRFPRQPNSTKRAEAAYAALQGFSKNVKFYQRSKVGKTKLRPFIKYEMAPAM
jgi:RNA recognition motif-containing protein